MSLPSPLALMAEASTTSTSIPIGADHGGGLAGSAQPEPADLGEDVGLCRGTIVLDGCLDDGEQFALQGPVMPLGPLPQPLDNLVWRVLDAGGGQAWFRISSRSDGVLAHSLWLSRTNGCARYYVSVDTAARIAGLIEVAAVSERRA